VLDFLRSTCAGVRVVHLAPTGMSRQGSNPCILLALRGNTQSRERHAITLQAVTPSRSRAFAISRDLAPEHPASEPASAFRAPGEEALRPHLVVHRVDGHRRPHAPFASSSSTVRHS
jgi:hypothetical protein